MNRILIRNAAIATVDDSLGDIPRGDILIEGDRIVRVEPSPNAHRRESAAPECVDTQIIDASDMIAIPGLVDTHRHTWQTGLRGILADGNIPDYLRGIRLQMAPRYRAEDMYAGNYVGALDALNSGVTTIVDYCHNILSPDHARAAVEGLRDAGISGVFAHGMTPITSNTWGESQGGRESSGADPGEFSTRARLARAVKEEYFADSRSLLRFGMAPQEFAIAPAAEVVREFALARELDARITLHANQVMVRQLFRDVAQLADHRLLGDDVLLVHCTFNTPEEWRLLDGSGVKISVCAETEMQMGMGYPAIAEATQFGASPSLGIDCVSGCGGDMISHARFVLQATRYRGDEPGYAKMVAPQVMRWTTKDALRWATLNGAEGAGLADEIGSITPGKRADIVLVDMSGVSQLGWNRNDPTGAVISQAHAGCVDTVLVAGAVVKRGGTLVNVDLGGARSVMDESSDYLYGQMDRHGGFIPQPPVEIPLYDERA